MFGTEVAQAPVAQRRTPKSWPLVSVLRSVSTSWVCSRTSLGILPSICASGCSGATTGTMVTKPQLWRSITSGARASSR
jgi:hypothetical protein